MTAHTESTKNPIVRFLNMNTSREVGGRELPLWRQILLQVLCLVIAAEVLFPIMYIVTLSFSSRETRPASLELIPTEISFAAYKQVIDRPTANPITFIELLRNSFLLSVGVGLAALMIAVLAAYAFSRFKFKLRSVLMVLVFVPLLMPAIGLSTPLYLLMNSFRIADCGGAIAISPFASCAVGLGKVMFNLRDSLLGVGIAMISTALPFAVWNLKGYLDTIPKELEEAAAIDGADPNQVFFQIVLPLALPQLAVTFFLGFIGHWQEFALPWLFLTQPESYTLSMTLYNMTGQYANSIPWNRFAAMAIIVALPVAITYIALQKQIVSGLTSGGVKG
ncbi:MAG TPA: carbohydrate ABC transporter permease [Anaerolineales bacterium]|nr:carbohydrate ABC transporter permease [Anaerolineales bacterium]HMR98475.1 carbohydrate ABC transporter permease [Anaerolineales bacterium]HNQ96198.1 carbohydrate ABC transporter permease [Anaerolineales bacterium]HNS60083.1 carbohydrate ABC transporter permease [Anaerolineales bacterium]